MRGAALVVLVGLVIACGSATSTVTLTADASAIAPAQTNAGQLSTTSASATSTATARQTADSTALAPPSPTPSPTGTPPSATASTPGPTATATATPTPTATPQAIDPEPTPTPSVRLMAVGDVMLGWEVGRKIKNVGVAAPWAGVKRYFDEADLVVANLECVISNIGTRWPSKLIHLRAPLAAADSLVAGGIDLVSVANNHALDFGRSAFMDSLSRLDARGIQYAGGGADAGAARAPVIVEENGLKLAFLGYVLPFSSKTTFSTREWQAAANQPGLTIGTPDAVRRDVNLIKESVDLVVVMVHGGLEYRGTPSAAQRAFANAALDAGASLVLGHHPHVLQGYAKRGDKLIAFSLGNFMFARFDGRANDSAILDVTLTRDGVATLDWIPVVIRNDGTPRPATSAEARRIMGWLPSL